MSKIWPMVPLGEVLTERKETPSLSGLVNGTIKIVSKIGFNEGKIQLRNDGETKTGMILIRPSDLVVSGINAAKGAIAIYGEENTEPIAATIHYGSYIPNKERADIKFLWWLLRSHTFKDILNEYVPGGIKTELKAKRLLPIPIPLPPLSEQQRIVARIEELAAKIEKAKGLRQKAVEEAEALRNSVRIEIFNEMPAKGVKVSRLDEVAPVNMGQSPQGHTYNNSGEGIPLLNGPTEFGSINPTAIQWTTSPNKLCTKGDILLCVRGATTGKMNWADREYCIGRGLAALTAKSDICLPEYVYHYVKTQVQQMLALSAGSTFTNLPGAKLKSLGIPVPSLPEQRRIVAYLDDLQAKVDILKRLQAETQKELDALLPSVLDKAFKGEL